MKPQIKDLFNRRSLHPLYLRCATLKAFEVARFEREGSKQSLVFKRSQAFTLLEAVIATSIFMLLMVGVAALWSASWKAVDKISGSGLARSESDILLRRLGEAADASVFHTKPKALYSWKLGDSLTLNSADISFVTTFPPDAGEPNVERAPVERILLKIRDEDGRRSLVMFAAPFTMEEGEWQREVVLMDGVEGFRVRFWDEQQKDWTDRWDDEAKAPKAVQFSVLMKGEVTKGFDSYPHYVMSQIPPAPKREAYGNTRRSGSTNSSPGQITVPGGSVQIQPVPGGGGGTE
jgi:hypothetical protein